MAGIHRIFFMHFDESSGFVEDFLPEAKRRLLRIHFLQVAGFPSLSSGDFEAVTSPAAG